MPNLNKVYVVVYHDYGEHYISMICANRESAEIWMEEQDETIRNKLKGEEHAVYNAMLESVPPSMCRYISGD